MDVQALLVFTDANYLQEGYIIFATGKDANGEELWVPVLWSSRRIKREATSTLTAELVAAQDGTSDAVYLRELWADMTGVNMANEKIPIRWATDCNSLFESIWAPDSRLIREKRFTREIVALRQDIKDRILDVVWVPTHQNVADPFTKPVSADIIRFIMETAQVPAIFRGTDLLSPSSE